MEIQISSFVWALIYLGGGFMIMIFVLQYKWAKTCNRKVRTLTALKSGGGKWGYADKEGGSITLYNKELDETKVWAVNELATIEIEYPGVGFIPSWMQKSIRLVLLNEDDTEPILNRAPHRNMVASPDVIQFLKALSLKDKDKKMIDEFVSELKTYPTKPIVGDPATLGALMRQQAMRALAQVSNELMDTLKTINTKLARIGNFNATYIYILIGFNIILSAVAIYFAMQAGQVDPDLLDKLAGLDVNNILDKLDLIHKALGITP